MTSPVLLLFLAFVCSTFGTASKQSADYDRALATMSDADLFINGRTKYLREEDENQLTIRPFDEIYNENTDIMVDNLDILRHNIKFQESNVHRTFENRYSNQVRNNKNRVKRSDDNEKCEAFLYNERDALKKISHPHGKNSSNYYNNTDCVTIISAPEGNTIDMTFVDVFHIEYHPDCIYDYLEVRDGLYGYARLLGKVCGEAFPRTMSTTGPYAWLKFHSDETIEYEGFQIEIKFKPGISQSIPESCYDHRKDVKHGEIKSSDIDPDCKSKTANQALDFLWTIETAENRKIYLNFTHYKMARPNECEENYIQIFGSVLELDSMLEHYCGSMATFVTTKEGTKDKPEKGNIMHIRLYASKLARADTSFNATYTSYRTLDSSKDDKCDEETEFNCEDNTCIDLELKCNGVADCRLKTDEDKETCKVEAESMIKQPHILVILVIFSLILTGMSMVFLFKCGRKLYQDHKIIKEHIRQSCEDRLDSLVASRLTLDAKRLQRDSEPRASLERDNHTNEMFKQQRSFSKHHSIESDFEETHLDIEEEPWRREVDSVPIETDDIRIEHNGRTRRSDLSRKEESIRSKRGSDAKKEKKQNRDVSVGAPDTKESGCQTRESLFQTDPPPSSDGSGTNSRGFSTFGYSGATIARPSPPPQTKTSEITIELLKQVPRQESKPQKKIDRRPISTETTRSAPDVIIVSKPIR